MANVPLIKDDGQPLNLPAGSIHLILDVPPADPIRRRDPDAPERRSHPDAESLVFTDFMGGQVYWLLQRSSEVLAAVEAAQPEPRDWISLPSLGEGRFHCVLAHTIRGYEGHATGALDGDGPWVKVVVERPTGQMPSLSCAHTPETFAALDGALSGGAPSAPPPSRQRPGRKAGRRR